MVLHASCRGVAFQAGKGSRRGSRFWTFWKLRITGSDYPRVCIDTSWLNPIELRNLQVMPPWLLAAMLQLWIPKPAGVAGASGKLQTQSPVLSRLNSELSRFERSRPHQLPVPVANHNSKKYHVASKPQEVKRDAVKGRDLRGSDTQGLAQKPWALEAWPQPRPISL